MDILVVNFQDRRHPYAGGAEVHLHELFGRLVGRGHTVTLLCAGSQGATPRETIDGIEIHRVGSRLTFALHARRYFERHLGARRFSVIVEDLNKVPLRVWRWSSTPTLLLVHHLFGATAFDVAPWPVSGPLWLLERWLGRLYPSGPVVAVSESTACELERRGIDPTRIAVIPNGVDTRYYRPCASTRASDEPMLVFVGRLQRYKRVDLLVSAMAVLRSRGVRCRLVIAGDGECAAELAALVRELDLNDTVGLVGQVTQSTKRRLLRLASAHLIASKKEGWGLTVLEAAACGVPTVATDAQGLRDSVIHERTGLLVASDSSSLADAVTRVLQDVTLRTRLGTDARRFAESLDWNASALSFELALLRTANRATAKSRRVPLVQRHPLATVNLPRLAEGPVAHGTSHYRVVSWGAERSVVHAKLGSADANGRHPSIVFEVVPPELLPVITAYDGCVASERCDRLTWPLLGWPSDPVAWLTRQLAALAANVGSPVDVHVALVVRERDATPGRNPTDVTQRAELVARPADERGHRR